MAHKPVGSGVSFAVATASASSGIMTHFTDTVRVHVVGGDAHIAVGIDRIKKSTVFEFNSIAHKWSGLRTFVSDKSPVIGFENNNKNFFWLVGQGGYGIQTAPALAEISANLILEKKNNFFLNNSTMHNISIERIRNEIL